MMYKKCQKCILYKLQFNLYKTAVKNSMLLNS